MTFEEWLKKSKTGLIQDTLDVMNFENKFPYTAEEYIQRKQLEEKKRSEIMQIADRSKRQQAILENMDIFQH